MNKFVLLQLQLNWNKFLRFRSTCLPYFFFRYIFFEGRKLRILFDLYIDFKGSHILILKHSQDTW